MNALLSTILIVLFAISSAEGQAFVNQYPNQYPVIYQPNLGSNLYQQPSYSVDAYRYVNPYLLRQYRSAQDFFATSRQDLDRKVNDAAELLNELRQNMNTLLVEARNRGDNYLQSSLMRLDTASQDIMNFQRQLQLDRTTPYQQLALDWQNRIQSVYDTGLNTVTRFAEMWNAGPKFSSFSLLCILLLTVALMLPKFL